MENNSTDIQTILEPQKAVAEPTVRDLLAIDRTHLANNRTFLAFFRTGLYFIVSGLAILKFNISPEFNFLSYVLIGLSLIVWAIGGYHYKRTLQKINQYYM